MMMMMMMMMNIKTKLLLTDVFNSLITHNGRMGINEQLCRSKSWVQCTTISQLYYTLCNNRPTRAGRIVSAIVKGRHYCCHFDGRCRALLGLAKRTEGQMGGVNGSALTYIDDESRNHRICCTSERVIRSSLWDDESLNQYISSCALANKRSFVRALTHDWRRPTTEWISTAVLLRPAKRCCTK